MSLASKLEPLFLMIRELEEISANAWPAPYNLYYDGWVLRYAQGYTSRANSVFPFYGSTLDITAKIKRVEAFYRERGLPAKYKLSEAVMPQDLDTALKSAGYTIADQTSVQTHTLADIPIAHDINHREVDVRPYPSKIWLDTYLRLRDVRGKHHEVVERVLQHHILPPSLYVMLWEGTRSVAIGRMVFERGYMGLFDVVVDREYRNIGLGSRFTAYLLTLARKKGARAAYLQVAYSNDIAFKMYQKLGFTSQYRYWYRVQYANEAPTS